MTHKEFMQQALQQAQQAFDEGEVPIGAVVVINEKIIARGYNQVEKLNDSTAHAEMIALTAAFNHLSSKYLSEATIYVTIEPCLMCTGAMYWSKIGKIVYGADDEKNGGVFSCFHKKGIENNILHPKTKIVKGVLQQECTTLIQQFFRERR